MIPGGIPTKEKILVGQVQEWVEQCRVSVPARASYYRLLNIIAETGRYDGQKALINTLNKTLDRTASHLFSPVELKFAVDFEHPHAPNIYEQAKEVAKVLTRQWDRNDTDLTFAQGVFEALKYGACIMKQWPQVEGSDNRPQYYKKLVMPWQFGVYREDENDLDKQEIVCETTSLTLSEVWQRIYKFPDRDRMFAKVKASARSGGPTDGNAPTNFFHQVLSTSQISTGVQSSMPGGIVQLTNDPNYAIMGPVIAPDMVEMHELWVKDEDDYTTIQFIEPDILIAPHTMRSGNDYVVTKKQNLLIQGSRMQPYRLIQPNIVTNWFWGRSELVNIIEPQMLLAQWCADAKRMLGLQIDKVLAFVGDTGITDERYDQFRAAGYIGMQQGSDVKDLTPKVPPELMPMIKWLLETINWLAGYPPVMQGQGESGVRAQSHADTLVKTGSPQLRDRSLIVERQCARAGDLTLAIMEAKDDQFYFTKADQPVKDVEETKFLLSQLPEDWRVTVDSHSSSPIFSDDNEQRVFAAFKSGIVDGNYVIDNTQLPNKESAKVSLRQREAAKAKQTQELLQSNPELGQKLMEKQLLGGRHR